LGALIFSQSLLRQQLPLGNTNSGREKHLQLLTLGLFSQVSVEEQEEALHLGVE
jgi:hypothetical protein